MLACLCVVFACCVKSAERIAHCSNRLRRCSLQEGLHLPVCFSRTIARLHLVAATDAHGDINFRLRAAYLGKRWRRVCRQTDGLQSHVTALRERLGKDRAVLQGQFRVQNGGEMFLDFSCMHS